MTETGITTEYVKKLLQAHPIIKAMIKNLSDSLKYRDKADIDDTIYGLATGADDVSLSGMPHAPAGTPSDRTGACVVSYGKMERAAFHHSANALRTLIFADNQIKTALNTISKNDRAMIVNKFCRTGRQFGRFDKKHSEKEFRSRATAARNIKRLLVHLSNVIAMTPDECNTVFKIVDI